MSTTNTRFATSAKRVAEMLKYLREADGNFGAYGSRYTLPEHKKSTLARLASFVKTYLVQLLNAVVNKFGPYERMGLLTCGFLGGVTLGLGTYYIVGRLLANIKRRHIFREAAREYQSVRDEVVEDREVRLRANEPYTYIERVAAEVRGKMGIPQTTAERVAAERLAYRIMRSDNHRFSHIERDLPFTITLILTPTIVEQQRAAYVRTRTFDFNVRDYSLLSLATGVPGMVEDINCRIPEEN